jgi:hypothetical protein
VAESLDQPRGVVAVNEAVDGLAQPVDGVVQLGPQALLADGVDQGALHLAARSGDRVGVAGRPRRCR